MSAGLLEIFKEEVVPQAQTATGGGVIPPNRRTGLGLFDGGLPPIDLKRFKGLGGRFDGISEEELDTMLKVALGTVDVMDLPKFDDFLKEYEDIFFSPNPKPSKEEVDKFVKMAQKMDLVNAPFWYRALKRFFTG